MRQKSAAQGKEEGLRLTSVAILLVVSRSGMFVKKECMCVKGNRRFVVLEKLKNFGISRLA